jgi:hypothetical protein
MQSPADAQRLVYRHTVAALLTHTMAPKKDHSTTRIMTNDIYFNTTISKISDFEIFFPTPQLYRMDCSQNSTDASCILGGEHAFEDGPEKITEEIYQFRIALDEEKEGLKIVGVYVGNSTEVEENYQCQDYFNEVWHFFCTLVVASQFYCI